MRILSFLLFFQLKILLFLLNFLSPIDVDQHEFDHQLIVLQVVLIKGVEIFGLVERVPIDAALLNLKQFIHLSQQFLLNLLVPIEERIILPFLILGLDLDALQCQAETVEGGFLILFEPHVNGIYFDLNVVDYFPNDALEIGGELALLFLWVPPLFNSVLLLQILKVLADFFFQKHPFDVIFQAIEFVLDNVSLGLEAFFLFQGRGDYQEDVFDLDLDAL